VAQFSYRLLTHVAWSGALLTAYALPVAFRSTFDVAHAAVGLLLVLLAHGTFLPPLTSSTTTVSQIVAKPDTGYGSSDYLVSLTALPPDRAMNGVFDVPVLWGDGWLKLESTASVSSELFRRAPAPELVLVGEAPAEVVARSSTLTITMGDQTLLVLPLKPGSIDVRVPLAGRLPSGGSAPLRFTFGVDHPIESPDSRKLAIHVNRLQLTGLYVENAVPLAETLGGCARVSDTMRCQVTVTNPTGLVQLPVLFYPNLLTVRVDGHETPYFAMPHRTYALAGVKLGSGQYTITARFRGLWWANLVSGVAWGLTLAGFAVAGVMRIRAWRQATRRPLRGVA
jgi:hypothetical protein